MLYRIGTPNGQRRAHGHTHSLSSENGYVYGSKSHLVLCSLRAGRHSKQSLRSGNRLSGKSKQGRSDGNQPDPPFARQQTSQVRQRPRLKAKTVDRFWRWRRIGVARPTDRSKRRGRRRTNSQIASRQRSVRLAVSKAGEPAGSTVPLSDQYLRLSARLREASGKQGGRRKSTAIDANQAERRFHAPFRTRRCCKFSF